MNLFFKKHAIKPVLPVIGYQIVLDLGGREIHCTTVQSLRRYNSE